MFGRKDQKKKNRHVSPPTGPQASRPVSRAPAQNAPIKEKKPPVDRSRMKIIVVVVFFGLIWGALWARAAYVQVIDGPRLAAKAERQHKAKEVVLGERGQILDRNGKLLAKSVEFTSVYVRPAEVKDPEAVADMLSRSLGLSRAEAKNLVQSKDNFKWAARHISDQVANVIKEAGLDGVHLSSEIGRQYPNAHMAGQLLGFVGVDGQGLEGLELAFNEQLSGRKSEVLVQRDARGRILYLNDLGQNVDLRGQDLRLTIDSNVQFAAEEALARSVERVKAKTGSCLVVDVPSGDILAWAEYPFFNPNAYKKYAPDMRRNHIASDIYEPGSTMKPFLIAAAMQEGVVNKDTLFFCEQGRWKVGRKIIRDTHSYDWLPVSKIVRYSSNIGSAKIGMVLGARSYHDYMLKLGLGEKTGLPLAGESKGLLRDPGNWREIDLATASFGQGIGFTALQMTQAYLCLANQGVTKPLNLVVREGSQAAEGTRVFSPEVAAEMMDMLNDVVETDGTGTRARIEGVKVAGKTGTAQKASAGGYTRKLYLSSFVGIVPADAPKYLVMVMVDEPETEYYGSTVAGPAFKEIALRVMAYKGDLADTGYAGQSSDFDAPELSLDTAVASGPVVSTSVASGPEASAPEGTTDQTVPNLVGLPLRQAMEVLASRGIVPVIKGSGLIVERQTPAAGSGLPQGQPAECVLWLASGK